MSLWRKTSPNSFLSRTDKHTRGQKIRCFLVFDYLSYMKVSKISLQETHTFSSLFLSYIDRNPALEEFYGYYPTLENFAKQIAAKAASFSPELRKQLVKAVTGQYYNSTISAAVKENITLLGNSNTFTVTTGHQLCLFTGPLYFIYKIVTVINLAKELKQKYPDSNFVPVYWLHAEDHDFEEINHFTLFGKTYTWYTDQKGATGRIETKGLEELLANLPERLPLMEKAYSHAMLAEATRYLVNELFGEYGLIILSGDDEELKRGFVPYIKDELLYNSSHEQVNKTNAAMEAKGFDPQITAREINLFYMDNGLRERIVKEGDHYKVVNSNLSFSENQLLELCDKSPNNFSPNVVTRPLYQEVVLPNLAYIGGPAEVAYWLQLKGFFDYHKIPFPILIPRSFAMILPANLEKKLHKLETDVRELFYDDDKIRKRYVDNKNTGEVDFTEEQQLLEKAFEIYRQKAAAADKTLEAYTQAEKQKALKIVESVEKRIHKAVETKFKTDIEQLQNLRAKLFPNGSLQERVDNFLNFYINDPAFIEKLLQSLDPLDFRFNILTDEKS